MLFTVNLPAFGEVYYTGDIRAEALKMRELEDGVALRLLASIEGDVEPFTDQLLEWELGVRGNYSSQDDEQDLRVNEIGVAIDISNDWNLFIGRKVLYWSRTDEINPIDVVNQEDFRRYLIDTKEQRKLGRDMLLFAYEDYDRRIDIAILPRYEEHVLPGAGDIWCASTCLGFDDEVLVQTLNLSGFQVEIDENFSDHVEAALRYSDRWRELDYGFTAFYGADKFPVIKRTFISPTQLYLERINPSRFSFGFDGATSVGAFAFRWEMLYTQDKVFHLKQGSQGYLQDDDGLQDLDELFAVVGVDYSAPWDIYTNLQFVKHKTFDDPAGEIIYPEGETMLTWLISTSFYDDEAMISFEVYHDLEQSSDFMTLKGEYKVEQQVTIGVTVQVFDGQAESQFGQYNQHDLISASVSYVF